MRYRRTFQPGGTFFFTVVIQDRSQSLLTDNIDLLRHSFRHVQSSNPFRIDAIVVLPDHLHTIWTLPADESGFSRRWQLIKSRFSFYLQHRNSVSESQRMKREKGIWQRRFWEHLIRNESDYQGHMDYIHFNPVKHGYVCRSSDWPYSSIHRYISKGVIAPDWAVVPEDVGGDM